MVETVQIMQSAQGSVTAPLPLLPRRVFLSTVADKRFEAVRVVASALSGEVQFQPAYSVKTNPKKCLLDRALQQGFLAEVISHEELRWARKCGFSPGQIVHNGPVPLRSETQPRFAFADSVDAFHDYLRRDCAEMVGIRLRPSMLHSRFGAPRDQDNVVIKLLAATGKRHFCVSFHARPEDFGRAGWRDVAEDVLVRAHGIARSAGCSLCAFDVGGGWTPAQFDRSFESDARWLKGQLLALVPECKTILFEPGQAIATPTEALLAQVVEVRRRGSRQEVIINAGYPDWPQMHEFNHRIYARDGRGSWSALPPGPDSIGGRTCLEYDRIEGVRLPANIEPGMEILVGDCGAYDGSMGFRFGIGGSQ